MEGRGHVEHTLDRLTRRRRLIERAQDLHSVTIAEHARCDAGDQPHKDHDRARDPRDEPAVGDDQSVEGDARRQREACSHKGAADESATDHYQRGDGGRHADVRLAPVGEVCRDEQREVDHQSADEHAPRPGPQPSHRAHHARTERQRGSGMPVSDHGGLLPWRRLSPVGSARWRRLYLPRPAEVSACVGAMGSSDPAREAPPAGRLALRRRGRLPSAGGPVATRCCLRRHVAAECRHCRPTADQTGKPRQMVLVGHPESG